MNDLARDLVYALDPTAWALSLGLELDDWQATVLSSNEDTLLNCGRQTGKSTAAALIALHRATYHGNSLVLLLSPSLRQSSELFRKCLAYYDGVLDTDSESQLRIEFVNGSRIIALPGNERTVRGYSAVNLVIIDEAARTDDELYYSLRPMLAVSGGRMVALSTPFGKRGWWYEEWTGVRPWLRIKQPTTQCPRISAEFLEQERAALGDWWYEQEYLCVFHEALSNYITDVEIHAAITSELEPFL